MLIVAGTTSTKKLDILKRALNGQLVIWGVEGVAVSSETAELSKSIEATEQKAVACAKEAHQLRPRAGLTVGLDVGLEDRNGIFWLTSVAAFWDGVTLAVGRGDQVPLPVQVSDMVKEGGSFETLIAEYRETAGPDEERRIEQLISWDEPLTQAIQRALPQVKRNMGISSLTGIAAIFTSEQSSGVLFRISAIFMGAFFGLRAIIAFTSPLLGFMQMLQPWFVFGALYQALSLLIVSGFIFVILGWWRLPLILSLQHEQQVRGMAWLAALAYVPYITVWGLIIGLVALMGTYGDLGIMYQSWGDILFSLWFASVLVVAVSHWMLLQLLQQFAQIELTTKVYIFAGIAISLITTELIARQMDGPNPLLMPIYLLGLSWSVGFWRLSRNIDILSQASHR